MTDKPDNTFFVEPSDEGWTDLGNGISRRVRLHLPQMMMVEFSFTTGAIGTLHSHPHVQCSYVEQGTFDVTIAGETKRLGKGGGYIVPPHAEHGVVAIENGRLVDVFTPQRDDFLRA